jgi:hypothetical protein
VIVLYGCENWSLALKKEHRSGVLENGILKRIYRRTREEVAEGWRGLYNEELRILYASLNIIRVIKSRLKWTRHVARIEEMRNE